MSHVIPSSYDTTEEVIWLPFGMPRRLKFMARA